MNTSQKVVASVWVTLAVATGIYSMLNGQGVDPMGALLVTFIAWLGLAVPMIVLMMIWADRGEKKRR